MKTVRFSVVVGALFLLTGCQADEFTGGTPVSGAPASCQASCNREYDNCADRFVNNPTGVHPDQGSILGMNAVCPDQLKACLAHCAL